MVDTPVLGAVAGAACIATSATLVRLADVDPATAAVFRCAYALPVLGLLAWAERRRHGKRSRSERATAAAAGVFFALDLLFWHHTIEAVGAGIATVLGNLQVLFVGLAAWLLLGERPSNRLLVAIPVVFGGVVLISGVVGEAAYGDDPVRGVVLGLATSLAYAGFILVLRHSSRDLRRIASPLFDASAVAAVVAIVLAPLFGGVDLVPAWPSHAWLALLALTSQVAGWLLIARTLPRLPAALTSLVLLLQPMGALVLAGVVLGERPSPAQLAGCVVVLGGILFAARASGREPRPAAKTADPADGPAVRSATIG
jgi:drug/metabolite transporter (DMT)-like permease